MKNDEIRVEFVAIAQMARDLAERCGGGFVLILMPESLECVRASNLQDGGARRLCEIVAKDEFTHSDPEQTIQKQMELH